MKKLILFSMILILSCSHSFAEENKIVWEHEFKRLPEWELYLVPEYQFMSKIYTCNELYFFIYFMTHFTDKDTYPGILCIDTDGNVRYQKEGEIVKVTELRKEGLRMDKKVRDVMCQGPFFIADIPNISGNHRAPNYYRFEASKGTLFGIEGFRPNSYQPWQSMHAFFKDDKSYALSGLTLTDGKNARIDVHSIFPDEHNTTLLYRIRLETEDIWDSLNSIYPYQFSMINDTTFLVFFIESGRFYMGEYSFKSEDAENALPAELINSTRNALITMDEYFDFCYSPEVGLYVLTLDNKVIQYDSVYNPVSEYIIDFPEDSSTTYSNWVRNFKELKYLPDHFIFWGSTYDYDAEVRNFTIYIADKEFNFIEEIRWNHQNFNSRIIDIHEEEDGELIVLGRFIRGAGYDYERYMAKVRPGYLTSVSETSNSQKLSIHPNPAGDYITVENADAHSDIEIYSVLGIIQMRTAYTNRIDVSRLPAGVYFLRSGVEYTVFVKD